MSLITSAKAGLKWSAIDTFGLKLVSFATSILLARILQPEDFGLLGLIAIFISVGGILIDSGMASSLIRDQKAGDLDFSTVFHTNVAVSVLLYIGLFYLAPAISSFYTEEMLTPLVRVYGVTYVLSAVFITQQSRLLKNLQFKLLAMLNMAATAFSAILAISMAVLGYGVWSLVAWYISGPALKALAIWFVSDWAPSLSFSKEKLWYHFDYGYKLVLSGIMGVFTREAYSIVIGKKFDLASVGYYTRANSMKAYPVSFFGSVLNRVTFPLLSKVKDDRDKICSLYQSILRSSFLIMTLVMTTLIVVAKPLFVILLTSKWDVAAPYFQILALAGILVPVHSFNLNVFRLYGRTDVLLKLSLLKNFLAIVAIAIGLVFGIYGLLWASVGVSAVSLVINSSASRSIIEYGTLDQLKDMLPVVVVAMVAYLISSYLMHSCSSMGNYIMVLGGVTSFISIFLGLNFFFRLKSFSDTVDMSMRLYKAA